MSRRRVELHVVRLDVLLWSLGGFGEPAPDARGTYPLWVWRRIVDIAGRTALPGETREIAEKINASPAGLRAVIWQVRRGRPPPLAYRGCLAA